MNTFNANYWELYHPTTSKEAVKPKSYNTRKKEKRDEVDKHNKVLRESAKDFVAQMQQEPSELEKKMQGFLSDQCVEYEFQKPLYIKKKNGRIRKFYIADFYIPSKSLIIETDGKFHDEQIKEDNKRTKEITKYYQNMKVIRWRWHDFESYNKMKELIAILK